MNVSQAKISVLMGIYNCSSTLRESLDSIVKQTYQNWELILCDDCSTDNTYLIAKEYKDKYPDRIVLLKNDVNLTLAPTLNRCLSYATGDYIARQDGDDISHPKRFELELRFLKENPKYDLVATNMVSFDENGEKGIYKLKSNPEQKSLIKGKVTFSHATILMKTEVLKKLGGYSEKWYAKQAEDYELWSRFFKFGYKGYNLNENLYFVREDSETYRRKNIKRRLRGLILRVHINRILNASLFSYIYIMKDVVALFIPKFLFTKYYEWRIK